MKETLAIIGSGISGLGSAWYLRNHYQLKVYEKLNYVGGHTNTVDIPLANGSLPVDTGFIVFNKVTYPLLLQLFSELEVPFQKSDMSFALHNLDTGLQYNGSSLGGLFAQRKNLFRPSYYRFLLEINRFNTNAPVHLESLSPDFSLADYIRREKHTQSFVNNFLVPMASAVWSTPPDTMLNFPAATLIRFFLNHGFLGLNTQHQWYTVTGGSREYVQKIRKAILAAQHPDIFLETPAISVATDGRKVKVKTSQGEEIFDKVIIACHAPDALNLLSDPDPEQRKILSAFKYQKNIALLHSDESVMPSLRKVWSSWNYRIAGNQTSTVYWMNRLQSLSSDKNYFVSINEFLPVNPSMVIRSIEYEHPIFDTKAILNQPALRKLNERGPIYFAGAYFRYGFHEDGLLSAFELKERLL